MNNTEKAISLFKYIKELYAQRIQVITDVRKQQWCKFKHEIPVDEENIIFNYLDRTDEVNDEDTESAMILKIRKPEFEQCPPIPSLLSKWIESDWNNFTRSAAPIQKLVKYDKGKKIVVLFTEDENRVRAYKEWSKKRDSWVIRQSKIEKTRNLFNELYHLYIDLERDSETIEFMVGQGVLDCEISTSVHTYHPLLLKRVALSFDSKNNILTIFDTDTNPEIYTMLLQEIDYINHSSVKKLKEELAENLYHPLDRNDTPDYLKSFAHYLYSESKYENDFNATVKMFDKVIIYNNPIFFIRKRTGGVIKALEEIINQISETGELSGPLLNLIGENVSQLADTVEQLDLSQSLAAISGEDKDILLSKEANKEQLEIAKRIENYNAVLVQGPPGTGKTHTIANLMGHFLAQGKNILVTSHTKKALTVVKEKVVPELQNLCVAVLDDKNKDMERSVDGITEYISSHTSLQLEEQLRTLHVLSKTLGHKQFSVNID
ncbi:AAA domain-containing protein [Clostridium sp. DL1XJH146]